MSDTFQSVGPINSLKQAIDRAERIAARECEERFVVLEAGEYHVCDAVDLDTFFMGIRDEQIIYCTSDGAL